MRARSGSPGPSPRPAGVSCQARGTRGMDVDPRPPAAAPDAPAWPDVGPIVTLLARPPAVVNVGLDLFAESLQAQGGPVISVGWGAPGGGEEHPAAPPPH